MSGPPESPDRLLALDEAVAAYWKAVEEGAVPTSSPGWDAIQNWPRSWPPSSPPSNRPNNSRPPNQALSRKLSGRSCSRLPAGPRGVACWIAPAISAITSCSVKSPAAAWAWSIAPARSVSIVLSR